MAGKHYCTKKCAHTCGEAGGTLKNGSACPRPGCWGITGKSQGHYGLCSQHDPQAKALRLPRQANLRETLFVIEYCGRANCNATQAAQNAGYQGNRPTLGVVGAQLLKRPRIQAAIRERFAELAMPAEECFKRLSDMARLDLAPIVESDGAGGVRVKVSKEQVEETYGRLIREIECDGVTGRVTKIKFHDALAANRDIAKIQKLFQDSPTFNVTIYDRLTDAEVEERLVAVRNRLRPPRPEPLATNGATGNGAHPQED